MADPKDPSNPAGNQNIDPDILKEILKSQEQLNESLKRSDDYINRLKNNYNIIQQQLSGTVKTSKTETELKQELLATEKKILEVEIQKLEEKRAAAAQAQKQLDRAEQQLKIETDPEIIKILQQKITFSKEIVNQYGEQERALLGQKIVSSNLNELETERINSSIELGNQFANSITALLGISAQSGTVLGKLTRMGVQGQITADSFRIAKEQLSQTISPANMLGSLVDRIVQNSFELAKQQDATFANFEREVGGARKFEDQIWNLNRTMGLYGVSVAEAGEAYATLKKQFGDFESMTKGAQNVMASTVAQLSKLGINAEDTAKSMQLLTKGFGMTASQAAGFQKQLYGTAKAMGLPPAQVSKDFAAAAPRLASHGKEMTKVFLDLQKSAQNTGIEFNKLISMTSKFDTFEGAAQAAGQLNAILGGDLLNSVELMNADEAERIRLMQDALKLSGKTYDSMSKQERLAVAQAMGIDDLTELQKLMNNENKKSSVELMNQEKAQKEMNDAVAEATQMGEMWNNLLMKLALNLRFIMTGIKDYVLAPLLKLMDAHPGIVTAISALVLALGGFFVAVSIVKGLKTMSTAISNVANVGKSLATNMTNDTKQLSNQGVAIADTVKKIGDAAKGTWKEILALGTAFLMIGGGVALASIGLAELVKSFSALSGEQILGALGSLVIVMVGFVAMLYILSTASLVAAGPMLALGAAFLMIGGGIALASYGLSVLVKSFAQLNPEQLSASLVTLGIVMGGFTLIIAGFGIAVSLFGAQLVLATPGMLAFGAAIAFIGAGVGLASAGIGYMANSVANLFVALTKADPKNIKESFASLFDSISLTGLSKLTAFSKAIEDLSESLLSVLNNLSSVSNKIKEFSEIGITLSADISKIDSLTQSIISLADALSKPVNNSVTSALQNMLESIEEVSAIKIAALATVTTAMTKPTVSPATTAAATSIAGTNAASTGVSETKMVPVAIYIDGKKLGEILDPSVRRTIESKLNQIGGTGKIIPDAR